LNFTLRRYRLLAENARVKSHVATSKCREQTQADWRAGKSIVCYAILPAVLGKTHRRNERGGSPIRASILPDLSGHERAYFAVMHNAASTPFSVLVW